MIKAHRKILLFLDNVLCHTDVKQWNLKLEFFPVNTTAAEFVIPSSKNYQESVEQMEENES